MKKLKHIYLFINLFLSLLCIKQTVTAQSIPQNLSTLNVNELSDEQIKDLLQQAQMAGKTDDQLIQSAKTMGMPNMQVQLLQARIKQFRTSNSVQTGNADTTRQQPRRLNYKADTLNRTVSTKQMFENLRPQIFGVSLFSNSNITFEPNLRLATPVNYIVGPDDELNINVYGNSLVNWKLNVSPEGNINIPGVGIVNVSGKTIEQATSAIKSKLAANNYAIGRGTNVQVTLGNIRSIKVIINGEVTRPGTYTLPSLATVFNALYASGGPNTNGSFRQIEVIRNNRVIRRLDVYDFLLKGDQKDNIALRDQDIIRVPTYRVRVDMAGEVKRPALYEVLAGETLQDVINFSGGFSDVAYTAKIKALQIVDQERSITDVFEADFKNYIPLRGDKYVVERILEKFKNRVVVSGAVQRPGDYELEKGLTISKLIAKAAGLREDAFTSRGSITRLKPDNTTESISFNVQEIVNKTTADILLQREDVVIIASIFDLRDAYNVTVKGEVRRPGDFSYSDSLTVEDLIIKAGGLTNGASTKRIEVSRRINNSNPTAVNGVIAQVFSVTINSQLDLKSTNFTLQPFDIVSVYTSPGFEKQRTVKVEGEVLYPGFYTIKQKNERISALVLRAGGITPSAYVTGGTLKRENTAILGFDKSKADTAALNRERVNRFKSLSQTLRDSSIVEKNIGLRNNYVGIDLEKILEKPGSETDLILEDGDVLRIPKQQQVVRVNGEVLFPSSIVYSKGKSFKSYVSNAGGFSDYASRGKSYVVYPNGTVKGTGRFLFFRSYPGIKPGSEVYVPKKQFKRGISTAELIGVTGGLASLGAIILGIINLSK